MQACSLEKIKIKKIMNKDLVKLIERLERIFPKMKMSFDAEQFNIDKNGNYKDCAPPYEIDWFDVIDKLKENGLEIKSIK